MSLAADPLSLSLCCAYGAIAKKFNTTNPEVLKVSSLWDSNPWPIIAFHDLRFTRVATW